MYRSIKDEVDKEFQNKEFEHKNEVTNNEEIKIDNDNFNLVLDKYDKKNICKNLTNDLEQKETNVYDKSLLQNTGKSW